MTEEQLVGTAHDDESDFIDDMERLDTADLIAAYASFQRTIKDFRDNLGIIEMLITQRMDADGATMVPADDFDVKLEGGYDDSRLHPLLESEHVTYEELVKAGAFIPEHEETKTVPVPDKWNATKLKPFGGRHREIQAIIDGAKGKKNRKLKITPKKEKKA